jgi:hypothetical protein
MNVRLPGLCVLAICAAGPILFAAQVVPLFPEYPPTPDAARPAGTPRQIRGGYFSGRSGVPFITSASTDEAFLACVSSALRCSP